MSTLSDCPPETAANICKLIEDVKKAFVQGELIGLIILPLTADGNTMGILAGDVILQLNGADVGNMQQFIQTIRSGAASSFRVWRNGQTVELTVPQSL